MWGKLNAQDISLAIRNAPANKPIECIMPPSNLAKYEIALYKIFPPGIENVVPQAHKNLIIQVREQLLFYEFRQSLSPEGSSPGSSSSSMNTSLRDWSVELMLEHEFVKPVLQVIPNLRQLADETEFAKETRENLLYNSQITKKYLGKIVRECSTCKDHGFWSQCSGCKKVYYCTTKCQREDWNFHKLRCTIHKKL